MLSGQEIGFLDSLNISVTGMAIVMLELALLALFVFIMSKVLAPIAAAQSAKAVPAKPAAPAPAAAVPAVPAMDADEEELAAIMVAVCEESGLKPEEIVFRSINEIK